MTRQRPWCIPDTVNTPSELEAFARDTRQPVLRLLWALGTIVEIYRYGRQHGVTTTQATVALAARERDHTRELAR